MRQCKSWSRREFNVAAAMAMLGGVTITVSCGGSNGSPTTSSVSSNTGTDILGVVGTNHGHVATITAAELTAGGALTLNITGSSNHPHTIEISASEVQQISGGVKVSKESSVDAGHSHSVTFN